MYIADHSNHHVQVLNPDPTFSHPFGKKGSRPGELKSPVCMAMDDKGMLYVEDKCNHRMQKFTPGGEFIAQFGKKGTGEGELIEPLGIAVDAITGNVYVSSEHKDINFQLHSKVHHKVWRKRARGGRVQ